MPQALAATAFTIGSGAALTAVSYGAILQAAITVYGVYAANEQARKAKKAAEDNLNDRTYGPGGTDAPTTTIYGRCESNGRTLFIKEATDASPRFFIVKRLSCDHEIDGFEEILFDGKPIGPYYGDLNVEGGVVEMNPGSPFYDLKTEAVVMTGTVPPDGVLVAKGVVQQVTLFQNTRSADPPTGTFSYITRGDEAAGFVGDEGVPITSPGAAVESISGDRITITPQYRGLGFSMTYTYLVSRGYVRLWCYRGTQTQQANAYLQQIDSRWNSNCALPGVPYIIAEITPDLDKFPNGMPDISAVVRGKRCFDPRTGQTAYTRNPALHILDHINSETDAELDDWDQALLIGSANANDEQVLIAAGLATESRYACDIELSSETDPIENVRIMLSTMAGSLSAGSTTIDIRSGVAQTPVGELTDNDLADENWSVQPFAPALDLFNGVRGRFTQYLSDKKTFTTTDFQPYSSPYYREQDAGIAFWASFDLPAVQSATQAMRIAKIELHRQRNTLTFRGVFKLGAMQFAVGQVLNLTMACLGQDTKPYEIIGIGESSGSTVELTLREQANAIFDWSYREGVDPDPAPNTNLPDPFFVPPITGLKAESGKEVAIYGANGTVDPVLRIQWDPIDEINTLYGGYIEIWHKTHLQTDFIKVELPASATRYDARPVVRGEVYHIQVRAVNAIQTRGKWAIIAHTASDAPTSYLIGNLLENAAFATSQKVIESGTDLVLTEVVRGWDVASGTSGAGVDRTEGPLYPVVDEAGQTAGVGTVYSDNLGGLVPPGSQASNSSNAFAVTPGERLVVFGSVKGYNCDVWMVTQYLTANMLSLAITDRVPIDPHDLRPINTPVSGAIPREVAVSDMVFCSRFEVVPAGAAFARLGLRRQTTAGISTSFWHKPYFGRASPGQVTLPPWSA